MGFRLPRRPPSIFILLVLAGSLPGQEAPHWTTNARRMIPTPAGAAVVDFAVDLAPTSDAAVLWREYETAKREFLKWFEETRTRLEGRFNGAAGDAKVSAGKDLIEFILEAERRWDEIRQPRAGTWKGRYSQTVKLTAPVQFLDVKLAVQGEMTFTMTDEGPGRSSSRVEGRIENGTTHVDFGASLSEAVQIFQGAGDTTWDGQVLGLADAGLARVIIRVHEKTVEAAFGVAGGFGGYGRAAEGRGTAQALYMDDLRRIYRLAEVPFNYADTWDEPELLLGLTGREEEFDVREYLDRYFRLYVDAIQGTVSQKFSRQQSHAGKRDEAWRGVNLFLEAAALGDAAGVDLGVMDDAGLGYQDPGSRFDEWFRKWFTEAMADWDERVGTAAGEAKIEPARGRHEFAANTISYEDFGLFSAALFQELNLFLESALMDATYKAYYDLAFQLWLGRVRSDRTQLNPALAWLSEQAAYAGMGVISSNLGRALGLMTTPPSGGAELRRAAEGR